MCVCVCVCVCSGLLTFCTVLASSTRSPGSPTLCDLRVLTRVTPIGREFVSTSATETGDGRCRAEDSHTSQHTHTRKGTLTHTQTHRGIYTTHAKLNTGQTQSLQMLHEKFPVGSRSIFECNCHRELRQLTGRLNEFCCSVICYKIALQHNLSCSLGPH